MPFTDEQVTQLAAALDLSRIAKRQQPDGYGRSITLDYLETYDVIDAANRIFGFDGWAYDLISISTIAEGQYTAQDGKPHPWAVYEAQVEVRAGGVDRTDVGHGLARPADRMEVIEMQRKGAVSDALKRALRSFGPQFGNSLYDKQHESPPATLAPPRPQPETAERLRPRPVAPSTGDWTTSPMTDPQRRKINFLLHDDECPEEARLAVAARFGLNANYDQAGKLHFGLFQLTGKQASGLIDALVRAKEGQE